MAQSQQIHDAQPNQEGAGNFRLYEPCLGDFLKPEYAAQQQRKISLLLGKQVDVRVDTNHQPDLLKFHSLLYTFKSRTHISKNVAQPIKAKGVTRPQKKFNRKMQQMLPKIEGEVKKVKGLDLLKMENTEDKEYNILDELARRKPYWLLFKRMLSFRTKLGTILEEQSETKLAISQPSPAMKRVELAFQRQLDLKMYKAEAKIEQEPDLKILHHLKTDNRKCQLEQDPVFQPLQSYKAECKMEEKSKLNVSQHCEHLKAEPNLKFSQCLKFYEAEPKLKQTQELKVPQHEKIKSTVAPSSVICTPVHQHNQHNNNIHAIIIICIAFIIVHVEVIPEWLLDIIGPDPQQVRFPMAKDKSQHYPSYNNIVVD